MAHAQSRGRYTMKNIWILFLILVFHVGPGLAQSELGPRIGSITKDNQYSLWFDFGLEQFEGEKRTTHRFQLWAFICEYPPHPMYGLSSNETYCSVKRTILDRSLEDRGGGIIIGQRSHYATDGTLKFVYVDWEAGKLDLQLTLDDKTTIEVMLRLQYEDNTIYLKDFKAIGIAKGRFSDTMEAIEYRIPEYTYTLDIPVQMKGLKSEDDKKRDEMLQSLTEEDRLIWENMQTEGVSPWDSVSLMSRAKELIPDIEEIDAGTVRRDLSPEETKMLGALMFEEAKEFFGAQGFSEDGLKKILDWMERGIDEIW